jgi:Sulfatase
VLAAFGLTTICLAQLIEPLVRSTHDLVYHWSGRPSALFGPPIVEFAIVFFLLAALLVSAEHQQGIWRSLVWSAVILFQPWVAVHQVQLIWPGVLPHWFRLPPFYLALIAWPLLAWIWSRYAADRRDEIIGVASLILAFTALSSVLFVSQMMWFWWKARALNDAATIQSTRPAAVSSGKPRVIFILMDELSYQQVYEHRYPNLQLPAFDALAAEATVFSQVKPASNYTGMAIPALISGQPVAGIRARSDGMLEVQTAEKAPWKAFDERQTIFQDAINAGYETTVVGWYNPYCRILSSVLDSCYWTDAADMDKGLSPERSFGSNLLSSADFVLDAPTIRRILRWTLHIPDVTNENSPSEAHLDDYVRLKAAADRTLLDQSSGFTFLHLPIPHPTGIYNRETHQLTTTSSTYIDNLALADSYLAHARDLLEKSGQWDSSTVVLMGDHGWRTTLMWEQSREWTPEEQRASLGGTFDKRPAYIVKLAGQKSGATIDEPFDALRTRALTDQLLAGEIQSPEQLKEWVGKQGTKEQTASGY